VANVEGAAPSSGRPLRIAMVNDIAGVAASEVCLLRQADVDVDYYPLARLGADWRRPWKILALPVRLALYLPVVARLRRRRYDLIHVHFVSQGVIALAAGGPFVVHAHGSDLHQNFQRRWMRFAGHYILRRASLIIYVTPNLRHYLEPVVEKAWLIGNPIRVNSSPRASGSIRRAIIFARLERVKGVEIIFEGIEQIVAEVDVTTINWGPWADQYRRRFHHIVDFIEPVEHRDIPSMLAGFDVVIGQMRQGILGLSELEAMAAGRPVLTNLNAALYHDDPPPVVHVGSAADIVTALRDLSSKPRYVEDLTQLARAWVERNHGPAIHQALLLNAYAAVLGASPSRHYPRGTGASASASLDDCPQEGTIA
jgi:glycosyltransferase involved in cell wall biosynthesis